MEESRIESQENEPDLVMGSPLPSMNCCVQTEPLDFSVASGVCTLQLYDEPNVGE